MVKKENYKCGYSKCSFGGEVNVNEMVKHTNKNYHQSCLKEMLDKNEIRNLFYENINKTEPYANFTRILNRIVHELKIGSDFLLFALQYAIQNKYPLKHAAGLYYLINDDKAKDAFMKKNNREKIIKMKSEIVETESKKEISFSLNQEKQGWDCIFKE
jgi:hypothetical protein